jgi:nucleotide-binding universal stress UspA family protein
MRNFGTCRDCRAGIWDILSDMKRVLMPVDFSPRDAAAAHYVRQLRRKLGFEVTLVHVVPPPDYEAAVLEAGGPVLQELMDTRRRLAEERLNNTCVKEFEGITVDRVLLEGFPSERIVEYAAEQNVDMIVLPTHGYGPFRRFLLGSVTAKVLHDSSCPVLTGAHMEEPKFEDIHFQRIAAAVDFSESSPKVIAEAKKLADSLGAQLVVMHALSGIGGHIGFSLQKPHEVSFDTAAKEQLEKLTEGMGVETFVETGDPGKTIASLVQHTGADLVVIARSTSHGLAAMRSYTYSIIRECGVPVLSV